MTKREAPIFDISKAVLTPVQMQEQKNSHLDSGHRQRKVHDAALAGTRCSCGMIWIEAVND